MAKICSFPSYSTLFYACHTHITCTLQLKLIARRLVSNEQGSTLAALQVYAGQPGSHRTLSAVVVHTVAVLLSQRNIDILCPLVTLLCTPGNMAVSKMHDPIEEYYVLHSCVSIYRDWIIHSPIINMSTKLCVLVLVVVVVSYHSIHGVCHVDNKPPAASCKHESEHCK